MHHNISGHVEFCVFLNQISQRLCVEEENVKMFKIIFDY